MECWGENLYHIHYEDSDEEDLSEDEVEECIENNRNRKSIVNKRPKKNSSEKSDKDLDDGGDVCSLWSLLPNSSEFTKEKGPVQWVTDKASANPPPGPISSKFDGDLISAIPKVVKFYLFIYERQRIWQRRANEEKPYTKNVMLREFHWCNNYRQLDRGTCYLRSQILKLKDDHYGGKLPGRKEWIVQVLWMSFCYRTCNQVESFDSNSNPANGIPRLGEFDADFRDYIMGFKGTGTAFFTGAHQTTTFDNYVAWCEESQKSEIHQVANKIYDAGSSLEKVFKIVKSLPGIGQFFAWQITCDLKEAKCLGDNVNENDFCELGPGAINGLALIFGRNGGADNRLERTKLLLDLQSYVEELAEISFPVWNNQAITLTVLEHGLCEYSKFCTISKANRGGRQTIKRAWKSRSYLDSKKQCHNCSKSRNACNGVCARCDLCGLMFCGDCSEKLANPCGAGHSDGWICGRCQEFEGMPFGDAK